MGVGRIGEVGDRASERQAAGGYGAGFTARSLASKRARDGTRGTEIKVNSELSEFFSSVNQQYIILPRHNH